MHDARLLSFDLAAGRTFPDVPFRTRHRLADHPLLSLRALAELAGQIDRDRVEYNSGRLNPNQPPDQTPGVDLEPADVVRQIETAGAWMVLKRVETIPPYRELIEACLADAATTLKHGRAGSLTMSDAQGFIFVSSANAVTPFHVDYEQNFFVHIRGEKFMHVFDNRDRSLVSDRDLETYPGKHRNHFYAESFERKAEVYRFLPGDGMFLPYTWPHWVRNGNQWTISMAITWKSPLNLRHNKLYFINAVLRRAGLPQSPPGGQRIWDGVKIAAYDGAHALVEPLRRSEAGRRRLRQAMFGRRANYFYGQRT
ncbi:MAG: transcriptional regulator [Bauldia sp.]